MSNSVKLTHQMYKIRLDSQISLGIFHTQSIVSLHKVVWTHEYSRMCVSQLDENFIVLLDVQNLSFIKCSNYGKCLLNIFHFRIVFPIESIIIAKRLKKLLSNFLSENQIGFRKKSKWEILNINITLPNHHPLI